MRVTHEHPDECLFTRHWTRVCSNKYTAQLEPVAPVPEEHGGAMATHSEQRWLNCGRAALLSDIEAHEKHFKERFHRLTENV